MDTRVREPHVAGRGGFAGLWQHFLRAQPDLAEHTADVQVITQVRNDIIHHGPMRGDDAEAEVQRANEALWRVADAVRGLEA
jgi:hypothetical protein